MADKPETKQQTKEENRTKKLKKSKDGASTPQNNNSKNTSRDNTPKLYTPKSSREGTPRIGTPKSSRGNTPKPSTPKPLPKFHYDRDELLKFRNSHISNKIPVCLSKYRDVLPDIILDEPRKNLDIQVRDQLTGELSVIKFEDGIDPESWYKHIHIPRGDDSRGSSPLTLSAPRPIIDRKPRHATDESPLYKRKDVSHDEEDGGGIVLGPQRKSFDTGCHVSSLGKSDRGGLDRTRRIGSGRIAMRHDSMDDDRGRNGERRELPDLESLRKGARGRFGDRNNDRFGSGWRDYDKQDHDRDYGGRRHYRRYDSGHHEQEPEWFSAGPTSQQDTIELRGFEETREHVTRDDHMTVDDVTVEEEEDGHDESSMRTETTCVSVADRNGSLETNESSSPETSHEEFKATPGSGRNTPKLAELRHAAAMDGRADYTESQFDFNDLFNLDNIPGLSSLIGGESEVETGQAAAAGMSRFSQFFRGGATPPVSGSRGPGSRTNSRRSSISEEFSYLNELINGSKSPALASPELDDPALAMRASPMEKRLSAHPSIMHLLNGVDRQQQQQQQIYHVAAPRQMPQGALNVSDVEANLKSLLMAKRSHQDPAQHHLHHPVLPFGGKVLTAEELEATLTASSKPPPQGTTPSANAQTASQNTIHSAPNIVNARIQRSEMDTAKSGHLVASQTNLVPASGAGYLATLGSSIGSNTTTVTGSDIPPFLRSSSAYHVTQTVPSVVAASQSQMTAPFSQSLLSTSHAQPYPRSITGSHRGFTDSSVTYSNSHIYQSQQLESSVAPSNVRPSSPATNISSYRPITANRGGVTTVAELEAGLKERAAVAVAMERLAAGQGAETSSVNDMAAFNRLLGLVKSSAHATPSSRAQQMAQRASPVPMAPAVNLQPALQQQQQPHADNTMLQKLLAHQQAQQQQQLNLQAQATKQLQLKHMQQQHQQQQAAMLKQLISQAPPTVAAPGSNPMMSQAPGNVVSVAPGNVAMTQTAPGNLVRPGKSPIPPPLNLQPPAAAAGARAPSPMLPPTSPQAPSPIMFGSQPPLHLTAPSPIHAAQMPRSPSPNTLQVTGGQRRVPSPQELHSHAQAIMQNALIKKQLEGQKQRFLQKQNQTRKTPSPSLEKSIAHGADMNQSVGQPVSQTGSVTCSADSKTPAAMTSTPAANKPGLNPAFTPTSVIRKMANDKMEEKERHGDEDSAQAEGSRAPVMKLVSEVQGEHTPPVSGCGDVSITVPPTTADSQAETELQRLQAQFHAAMEHVKIGQPVPGHSAPHASSKVPRPLVGQSMRTNPAVQPSAASNQPANQTPVAMQQQHPSNQTPHSVAMQQQLSHQAPHASMAKHQGVGLDQYHSNQPPQSVAMQLSNQSPAMALAKMQAVTSQAMHSNQMSMYGNAPNAAMMQGISSSQGRPIIKGQQVGQPMGMNTLSPPAQRPAPSHPHITPPQHTPTSEPPTPGTAGLQQFPPPGSQQTPAAAAGQRPIVGNSGMGASGGGGKAGGQIVDTVRLAEQARLAQIQAQLQAGHLNKGSPYAVYPGGRVPVQLAGMVPVNISPQQQQQAAVANALLMQRMMLPQAAAGTPTGLHPSQLAALQAAQLSQQQQQQHNPQHPRPLDNRPQAVQGRNPAYPGGMAAPGGRGIHGQGQAIMGRSTSPQQQMGGDGLAKFFGTDLLKQQLGSMPPLPNQTGQTIMTVEDLERRQQTVTN